jgi:hypothetical protein
VHKDCNCWLLGRQDHVCGRWVNPHSAVAWQRLLDLHWQAALRHCTPKCSARSFGGVSPERKAAQAMQNLFTFIAAKYVTQSLLECCQPCMVRDLLSSTFCLCSSQDHTGSARGKRARPPRQLQCVCLSGSHELHGSQPDPGQRGMACGPSEKE